MIGPGQRNHTLSDGCVPSHMDQDDVDDATVAQAIADLRRNRPHAVLVTIPKADYDALRAQLAEAEDRLDRALAAGCRSEHELADIQRGAAEEARQGDLARALLAETQDRLDQSLAAGIRSENRLAAALAVVEAAWRCRDAATLMFQCGETGSPRWKAALEEGAHATVALYQALDQLPRTTEEK